MLVHQYYDKDAGWCKEKEDLVFEPEKLIGSSIVVMGIMSIHGKMLWNARFGDYPPE